MRRQCEWGAVDNCNRGRVQAVVPPAIVGSPALVVNRAVVHVCRTEHHVREIACIAVVKRLKRAPAVLYLAANLFQAAFEIDILESPAPIPGGKTVGLLKLFGSHQYDG